MKKSLFGIILGCLLVFAPEYLVSATYHFSNYQGKPPLHIYRYAEKAPSGVTPSEIKAVYNLPSRGGHGTIALIGAYDDPTIEKDSEYFQ